MRQRMRTGSATKGAKDYDWAMTGILPDDTPDGQEDNGHAFLLLRRHRYTGTVSYYLCWSEEQIPATAADGATRSGSAEPAAHSRTCHL